ncbi:MAG: TonB-dependent receptor [Rhodothermales bacterium]|nr:TonB-dependent receptor [Rhodothermales bacterium]
MKNLIQTLCLTIILAAGTAAGVSGTTTPGADAFAVGTDLSETGSIHGVVTDERGEPIPAVQVIVHGTLRGALSDMDGRFKIPGLQPEEYQLEARFIGFENVTRLVRVEAGAKTGADFTLVEQTVDLGEITTEATRFPVSSSSVTLRSAELSGRPRRSSPELLELVPGLIASQHAGGGKAEQLFLRGFDADHGTDVALSLDGMPINLVSHGHGQGYADLHFFIPETVEAVRVEKGPHTADQGDLATAGSISFKTRSTLESSQIRLDAGSFNSRRALGMIALPGNAGYVAASLEGGDGPFESPQDLDRRHVFARTNWDLGDGVGLTVSGGSYRAEWTASGQIPVRAVEQGRINRFGAITDNEGGSTSRTWITSRADRAVGNGTLSVEGYLSRYTFRLFSDFTFFLEDPARGDMIEQEDDRLMGGGSATYTHRMQPGGLLVTGAHGVASRADAATVGLWQSPDRDRLSTLDHADVQQQSVSAWSQWTALFGPRVRLSAGARVDRFAFEVRDRAASASGGAHDGSASASAWSRETATMFSPKASLVLSPHRRADLFLSSGAGFHSNDARSVIRSPQKATPMARAWGNELGLRLRPVEQVSLAATLWTMDLESELVFVGDAGTTEVSGATRRTGFDLSGAVQLSPSLSITADLTHAEGRYKNAAAGEDRIPLAPRMTASGSVNARLFGAVDATLRAVHIGARPLVEDASLEAAPQTLVNLNLGYRIGDVSIDAALLNVMDAEWNEAQFATESRLRGEPQPVEELHFTPGAPRSFRLGLGYRF